MKMATNQTRHEGGGGGQWGVCMTVWSSEMGISGREKHDIKAVRIDDAVCLLIPSQPLGRGKDMSIEISSVAEEGFSTQL